MFPAILEREQNMFVNAANPTIPGICCSKNDPRPVLTLQV